MKTQDFSFSTVTIHFSSGLFFFFLMVKRDKRGNLASRPRAGLINQPDFMQEKYSDLKRLPAPSRSFRGVSDGKSADFYLN